MPPRLSLPLTGEVTWGYSVSQGSILPNVTAEKSSATHEALAHKQALTAELSLSILQTYD